MELAGALSPYHISFFEEPITQNDVLQMAELRRQTSIRVACGQNEAQSYRFRDMLVAGAVDVVQPNVVITGGYPVPENRGAGFRLQCRDRQWRGMALLQRAYAGGRREWRAGRMALFVGRGLPPYL